MKAQSVLQLPKQPTWVAEFPSNQVIDDEDILDLTDSQAADKLISYFKEEDNYKIIFKWK